MTEQWDASLRRQREYARRIEEEGRARSDAAMADIRRRQESRQQSQPVEPHGHLGWLVLLLLAAAILSRRIRKGLGIVVIVLGAIALLAWAVAAIGRNPDAANIALATGIFTVLGAGIWLISTVVAWLMKIVLTDVRHEFRDVVR
jgi:hypothetical protein